MIQASFDRIGDLAGVDIHCIEDPFAPKEKRFKAIRQVYAIDGPDLIERSRQGRWSSPCRSVDWTLAMTPIELSMWEAIRCYPFPLYPQYPVGRRFVDFGNPYFKVAVEVDSIAHHDPHADFDRDLELAHLGWTTYRVPSRFLFRPPHEPDTSDLTSEEVIEARRRFMETTPEGLLEALRIVHIAPIIQAAMADGDEFEEIEPDNYGEPDWDALREAAESALCVWRGRGTRQRSGTDG